MSTRAMIKVYYDLDDKEPIASIYHHWDGYPSYLGVEIAKCLGGREVVLGISDPLVQANGMADVAALLVAHLKEPGHAGNVYILPHDAAPHDCDYLYEVRGDNGRIHLTVRHLLDGGVVVWDGYLDDRDAVVSEMKSI